MPDLKSGAGVALWVVGVLVLAMVARIGWEIGGKIWGIL